MQMEVSLAVVLVKLLGKLAEKLWEEVARCLHMQREMLRALSAML